MKNDDLVEKGSKWSYRESAWKQYDGFEWYRYNKVVVNKIEKNKVFYSHLDAQLGWQEQPEESIKSFISRFDKGFKKIPKEYAEEDEKIRKSFNKIFGKKK